MDQSGLCEANDIQDIENALIDDDIAYMEGDDIIVRMALREVSAPGGYGMSVAPNYMLVRYEKAATRYLRVMIRGQRVPRLSTMLSL